MAGHLPFIFQYACQKRNETGINFKSVFLCSWDSVLEFANFRTAVKTCFPTFGWGKHGVRLYAGRTRRGPPAPKEGRDAEGRGGSVD